MSTSAPVQRLFLILQLDVPATMSAEQVQAEIQAGRLPGALGLHTATALPPAPSTAALAAMTDAFGTMAASTFNDLEGVAVIPIWHYRGLEHQQMPVKVRQGVHPFMLLARLMECLSRHLSNTTQQFLQSVKRVNDSTLPADLQTRATEPVQQQPDPAQPGTETR